MGRRGWTLAASGTIDGTLGMQGGKTNSALGFMARVEFVRKSCAILWLGNNQNRFRTDYIENLMTCLDEVEKYAYIWR